jgi:hypothetical protein
VIRTRTLSLLAATAAVAAAVAPAAHAAKPKQVNPCSLATPGQVQMVSGNPVGAGKLKKANSITQLCMFNEPGQTISAVMIQVTTTPQAAGAFKAGQKSLPSTPISGIGEKAYQVTDNKTVAFLYKDWYVIVQPSFFPGDEMDLSKVPDLAKVVYQSLKSK